MRLHRPILRISRGGAAGPDHTALHTLMSDPRQSKTDADAPSRCARIRLRSELRGKVARLAGLEPATFGLEGPGGRYSAQVSAPTTRIKPTFSGFRVIGRNGGMSLTQVTPTCSGRGWWITLAHSRSLRHVSRRKRRVANTWLVCAGRTASCAPFAKEGAHGQRDGGTGCARGAGTRHR